MIYLDHAATTPLDDEVLNEMLPYLKSNFGNPSSQHIAGQNALNGLNSARERVAKILGCAPNEIYFTSGGTECANWVVKGVLSEAVRGKHAVISSIEHPAVIESALDMQKRGCEITFVNPDKKGVINPEKIASAIRKDTALVCVMAANNETGIIQPIEKIGGICRSEGVFFYSDCVQTAGVLPLPTQSVSALGISAHKFYGPKGVGAIYIKNGEKLARFMSGGHQERARRAGTVNVAGAVGLAAALEKSAEYASANNEKVKKLRDTFVNRVLKEIPNSYLNGEGERLPSNANISFEGCDGENILFILDLNGVAVSTGSACSAGAVKVSNVLLSMGLSEDRARQAVRFSFGKNNTHAEVGEAVEILKKAVNKIRNN